MKGRRILAFFIILALLLSTGALAIASLAQESTSSVAIKDFAFSPANITVPQGTTVTWTNQDNVTHTVFSTSYGQDAEPVFVSGPIPPGEKYSFSFIQSGTYGYHDTIYPRMTGTVTVTSSTSPANNQTSGGNLSLSSWTHMAVAHLDTQKVPGVGNATNSTHAEGMALFWIDQDMTQMNYMLFVSNATNLTRAHIQEWSNGTLGPVLVWLYPGNAPASMTPVALPGVSNGMTIIGNFTASNLVGPFQNKSLNDLVTQMDDNNTFAAWYSIEYPSGYMVGNITTSLSSTGDETLLRELGPQHSL